MAKEDSLGEVLQRVISSNMEDTARRHQFHRKLRVQSSGVSRVGLKGGFQKSKI